METTILIIRIILAIVFALSGAIVYIYQIRLREKLSWLREYSSPMIAFICLSKVVGALGLVLPLFVSSLEFLISPAALGLATVMALAIRYHLKMNEYKDLPAPTLFLALNTFVLYSQF